jgi:hypothetical protein
MRTGTLVKINRDNVIICELNSDLPKIRNFGSDERFAIYLRDYRVHGGNYALVILPSGHLIYVYNHDLSLP